MAKGIKGSTPACSIEGCEKLGNGGRGWCGMHWWRWRHYGDPLVDPSELRRANRQTECSIDGCAEPPKARGWCSTHYWRWSKHGDPEAAVFVPQRVCSVPGCEKPHTNSGYCSMHRSRLERTGTLELRPYDHKKAIARFWAKVDCRNDDECWPWLGTVLGNGYGQFAVNGTKVSAHRYVYALTVGPIPEGLTIDHVRSRGCVRKDCVNPAHLEAVTSRENNLRSENLAALNAQKERCPRGHEYDYSNNGHRYCRTCKVDWQRAQKAS